MPIISSTNGTTQHTEAPMAASVPATSEFLKLKVGMGVYERLRHLPL